MLQNDRLNEKPGDRWQLSPEDFKVIRLALYCMNAAFRQF